MNRFARMWLTRALVAALGLSGSAAIAEDEALGFERTPPRLSFTDGDVTYWRPGASDWTDARVNTALAAGDELATGSGANLELQVGSRAWVRAGEASQLGLTSLEPDFLQLKLTTGTAALDLRELPAGNTLEIDTPNGAFTIERPGFYRVAIANDATTFVTRRGGLATVATSGGLPTAIEANEQLVVTGAEAPTLSSEAAPELDDWDRWNYSRSEQQASPASARYVPAGVYGAGDLDQYGSWQRVPSYGSVWVPRVVAGWSPYSAGVWVADPYYGWTWVDDAPWGWAPFHYGRWVSVGGYWAWAPGPRVVRAYYAPALVAFYGSSNFSIGVSFGGAPYAGWVALGWGEPIVPWWGPSGCRGQAHWAGWSGPRYVNNVQVNNYTTVNVNNIHRYSNADRRGAFVAVDRDHFGHGDVRDARVSRFDRSRMQPVGARELGARPERAMRVSAERRREAPARDLRERPVVTRRDTLEPGVRDSSRARTRETRGAQPRERGETSSGLQRERVARAERNAPPPTRMARADASPQRRSVSEPARASRGNSSAGMRERGGTSEPATSPAARSRDRSGARAPERTSRRERGVERDASPPPRDSQRRASREASPTTPRAEAASPRGQNRERARTRERSVEQAPRSFEGGAPRGQRFEQPAPSQGREPPAQRERQSEPAPQAAPAPSGGGAGGGQERRRGSGDGSGHRGGGGEGRRSQRGQG